MNAKDKAQDLVGRMYKVHSDSASNLTLFFSKQCALIAVDELISYAKTFGDATDLDVLYFENLKKEIQNYEKN